MNNGFTICALLAALALSGCAAVKNALNSEPTAEQKAAKAKAAEKAKPNTELTGGLNDYERQYLDAIHQESDGESRARRKQVFGI